MPREPAAVSCFRWGHTHRQTFGSHSSAVWARQLRGLRVPLAMKTNESTRRSPGPGTDRAAMPGVPRSARASTWFCGWDAEASWRLCGGAWIQHTHRNWNPNFSPALHPRARHGHVIRHVQRVAWPSDFSSVFLFSYRKFGTYGRRAGGVVQKNVRQEVLSLLASVV